MPPIPTGYFDAAAGLPLHPVAVEAWQAALDDGWADPGRLTGPGRRSAVLLDAAREAAAAELGVRPDELSFLPSGSHALQAAVLGTLAGAVRPAAGSAVRLVHSAVEHSTVLRAADWHAAHGGQVVVAPVQATGRVELTRFLALATEPGTATVAVLQAANHEVGSRQPVAEANAELAAAAVPLVVDASQELVYGEPPAAPVFSADARLWGGPAGVGLLAIRRGTRWRAPSPVDEAEHGRTTGPVSVPAIVAAAASLRAVRQQRLEQSARLRGLVDTIRRRVPELVPDVEVLGDPVDRLPHLVTFSCLYLDGEALLTELDRHGFAVSSGSSCTSDTLAPSHVLVAMGALSGGNVRVSLHPGVTEADVQRFLAVLPAAVERVRGALHSPTSPSSPANPAGSTGQLVDSRGRRCPLPVLDLARALPGLAIGDELTVLADDPAAAGDLAAWCRMTGQQLVSSAAHPTGGTAYRVRRVR
ncbi:MAG TPA: aminotransferase class V-fold PLP-dependent enzyme [Jatrophihabitans sp.]|nr:aminotransferase class V-fold PLP-dependent enzyme [Jatrophihabitans sp.]